MNTDQHGWKKALAFYVHMSKLAEYFSHRAISVRYRKAETMRFTMLAVVVCLIPPALLGQRKVDPVFQGERIYAIVPMVGAGTASDPRRPLFAPVHGQASAALTGTQAKASGERKP